MLANSMAVNIYLLEQKLKEKAAFRNPDEFYFKMVKTRTVDGIHKLEYDFTLLYT